MGFWERVGNVAEEERTKIAAKGIVSGARVVYDYREQIGSAAEATTRVASTRLWGGAPFLDV